MWRCSSSSRQTARQQIVATIAAIVDEMDRTFVAEIEAAVDPAPEWFEPRR